VRLTELEPEWVAEFNPATRGHRRDESLTIATAQGIIFACPKCFIRNGGLVGTHSILVWFRDRGVPDEADPGPGRWTVSGTGFDDLTLDPSIDMTRNQPDEWHGWVQNGQVR
jgi:hypothetical protein